MCMYFKPFKDEITVVNLLLEFSKDFPLKLTFKPSQPNIAINEIDWELSFILAPRVEND